MTAEPASSSPENSTPTSGRACARARRASRRSRPWCRRSRGRRAGRLRRREPWIARPPGVGGHGVDVRVDDPARRAPAREDVGAGPAVGAQCVADDDLVGAARAEHRREVLADALLVAGDPVGTCLLRGDGDELGEDVRGGHAADSSASTLFHAGERDLRERLREQRLAGLGAMPRRCARRMRQCDHIERVPGDLAAPHVADDLGELVDVGIELRDRELADGDDELRLEDFDLRVDVDAAALDLVGRRHAIAAAARRLAGKAAAHRGHVDAVAKLLLVEADLREPAEQRLARGPGKRFAGGAFFARRVPGRSASPATSRACR